MSTSKGEDKMSENMESRTGLCAVEWSKEVVQIYEETCEEYTKVKSSHGTWLQFLGAEY